MGDGTYVIAKARMIICNAEGWMGKLSIHGKVKLLCDVMKINSIQALDILIDINAIEIDEKYPERR